ncbi:MAG: glutathione-independent formaldehyde dehydrogenase [Steroidobacteraceae bacterium]|jgi:glutathione-independent formaldehyde dehydrogenase
MKAVVLEDTRRILVREVPDAQMRETTDVLLRITSSAICGTDLHFYEGRMRGIEGGIIGHEPLGVVEELGSAVKSLRKGDRVVVPTHICCGFCAMCMAGHSSACLTTNPGAAGAAYGYPNKGGYQGAQAQFLRVPLADANCLKLPGEPGDAWEDDFVLLADAFTTGYHATAVIDVGPGDTVAIFGAGAIGLLAAYSCRLRGAARIYVVDAVKERLEKAGELGAIPINFLHSDPVEQIKEQQSKWRCGPAFRFETPLGGVSCAIDAIGFQARSKTDYSREDPFWVIEAMAELVNPAGRISIVGVWPPKDAGAGESGLKEGKLVVPWSRLFNNNVSIMMGRDDDERWIRKLRDMIITGAAKPSQIVTHRLSLEEAPVAFAKFDARQDGYIKIILKPW